MFPNCVICCHNEPCVYSQNDHQDSNILVSYKSCASTSRGIKMVYGEFTAASQWNLRFTSQQLFQKEDEQMTDSVSIPFRFSHPLII